MSTAIFLVHWPGKSIPACWRHASQLQRAGDAMGFAVTMTPLDEGIACVNCQNEAAKEAAEKSRG
jgi:hypothetical protein